MRISLSLFFSAYVLFVAATTVLSQENVLTYHNHNSRNGWNPHEMILSPATVSAGTFGLLKKVTLAGQVDTQPLFVSNLTIPGKGVHSVVYVTTEENNVYAIDAESGEILLPVANLGTPVNVNRTYPDWCHNNGSSIGINGTGTIDLSNNTLYVVAYSMDTVTGKPRYDFHALDIATLKERGVSDGKIEPTKGKGPLWPKEIKVRITLGDYTSTTNFNAAVQRQRPGLLNQNGMIFAAFGSFCDHSTATPNDPPTSDRSRGWIISVNKVSGELAFQVTNRYPPPPASAPIVAKPSITSTCHTGNAYDYPCFMSSIWMSGYGIAGDGASDDPVANPSNIYFTTGNSADNFSEFKWNLPESAVKMCGYLYADVRCIDVFTPPNVDTLEDSDRDFGSGGLMLLPDQPGPYPHLAVAAGKDGNLYLLNRDDMSGKINKKTPASVPMGGCKCGPSSFENQLGTQIVTSGGTLIQTANGNHLDEQVLVWSLSQPKQLSSAMPTLTLTENGSILVETGYSPGFFTSISSNDKKDAIIWAVGGAHPDSPSGWNPPLHLTLYAFDAFGAGHPDAQPLSLLWRGEAGKWSLPSAMSNTVPTIANGRVYVASDGELRIFGLLPTPAK